MERSGGLKVDAAAKVSEAGQGHLGTILCKHCGQLIGTQETRKVTFYYSQCNDPSCSGNSRAAESGGAGLGEDGAQPLHMRTYTELC